jgi:putative transposase
MPRTARAIQAGLCYHLINRGNGRAAVFHDDDDYHAFVRLMRQATARVPLRPLAFCLMPNHFHLVAWPSADDQPARWMEWLLTTHVRRYRRRYGGSGHVWQGRYKAFPIAEDEHLLTVLRYVERNALRANLVERAEDWQWSSLRERLAAPLLPWLDPGPVPRPADWLARVNEAQTEAELVRLRQSVARGAPFGGEEWTRETAARLGLGFTLRDPGRPRHQAAASTTNAEQAGLFPQQ